MDQLIVTERISSNLALFMAALVRLMLLRERVDEFLSRTVMTWVVVIVRLRASMLPLTVVLSGDRFGRELVVEATHPVGNLVRVHLHFVDSHPFRQCTLK